MHILRPASDLLNPRQDEGRPAYIATSAGDCEALGQPFFLLAPVSLELREKESGTLRDLPATSLVVTWALGFSLCTSLSRVFKRKKRLLDKSLLLFAVSPATGRFDTDSPAPAARTTCRNLLGRGGSERGILWGCDWRSALRGQAGVLCLGCTTRALSVAGGLQPVVEIGTTPGKTLVCILEIARRIR